MKTLITAAIITTLNIQFAFIPNAYLLVSIFVLMFFDFITGIIKAKVKEDEITSTKLRATFGKFIQYIGAVLLALVVSFLVYYVPELQGVSGLFNIINNVILWIVSSIEIISILENLLEIDKKSLLSKYIFKPMHKLLTLQIKNIFND